MLCCWTHCIALMIWMTNGEYFYEVDFFFFFFKYLRIWLFDSCLVLTNNGLVLYIVHQYVNMYPFVMLRNCIIIFLGLSYHFSCFEPCNNSMSLTLFITTASVDIKPNFFFLMVKNNIFWLCIPLPFSHLLYILYIYILYSPSFTIW